MSFQNGCFTRQHVLEVHPGCSRSALLPVEADSEPVVGTDLLPSLLVRGRAFALSAHPHRQEVAGLSTGADTPRDPPSGLWVTGPLGGSLAHGLQVGLLQGPAACVALLMALQRLLWAGTTNILAAVRPSGRRPELGGRGEAVARQGTPGWRHFRGLMPALVQAEDQGLWDPRTKGTAAAWWAEAVEGDWEGTQKRPRPLIPTGNGSVAGPTRVCPPLITAV